MQNSELIEFLKKCPAGAKIDIEGMMSPEEFTELPIYGNIDGKEQHYFTFDGFNAEYDQTNNAVKLYVQQKGEET